MTLKQFWDTAKIKFEEYEDDYNFIGIRFEDKQRTINDICECSKHNTERDDDRDFPEFDTEEYNDLFEFDGTSAWSLNDNNIYKYNKINAETEAIDNFITEHCYIIAGNYITNCDDGLDDNEIVIEDAIVLYQMF